MLAVVLGWTMMLFRHRHLVAAVLGLRNGGHGQQRKRARCREKAGFHFMILR
jgi:hypothetical protein